MADLLGPNVRSFLILKLLAMKNDLNGTAGTADLSFLFVVLRGLIALRLGAEAVRCAQSY